MTIYNISITTPNTTTLYPVKAVVGVPTYDYIQCSPAEADGMAVLRYIPTVAEIVAGEFYANNTALKSCNKCTVQCTVVSVPFVNIYLSADGLTNWFYVGKSISTAGIIDFKVLPSDFPAGSSLFVKVEDADNASILDVIENQHIYITFSITASPSSTKLATNFTVSGKANVPDGTELTLRFSGVDGALQEYTVVVTSGAWSLTIAQVDVAHNFLPNILVDITIYDEYDVDKLIVEGVFDTWSTNTITPAIGDQTAGVPFNVAGETDLPDGAELEVFAGATSKGTAVVVSGAYTLKITIDDPVEDVIIKVQDVRNPSAFVTEEIVVASGVSTYLITDDGKYLIDDDDNKLII
jgi:hypothetical protein